MRQTNEKSRNLSTPLTSTDKQKRLHLEQPGFKEKTPDLQSTENDESGEIIYN